MATRQKGIARGDIFLVPLSDSTYSLGQVIDAIPEAMNSVLCAFFRLRGLRPRIDAAFPDEREIVSVQLVTPESLKKGLWVVVRNEPVAIDPNRYLPMIELAAKSWVGARIVGSANIKALMNAYFALRAWDDWHDPNFLDGLLAPGVHRPSNAILVKSS